MWIKRVVARSFGPYRGQTLHLGPGMTVVSGPNEAGKSTWHAAIRLAITGLRRGKGPGTAAERLQAERHRPWDDEGAWEVEARLALDDGREIDITQDLAGKVKCRAVDVGLGRDVSDEIMDGTPDASRWLGLTRDAFAATVSVSQAQILAVADAADELQEFMQRAAASHGSDATAAAAIERLEQFRKDAVGADTSAAKGPLRTARNRLAATEAVHVEARRLHAEYLERSAALEASHARAEDADARLASVEAALASRLADEAQERLQHAEALAERHPEPPPTLSGQSELADDVAGALAAWRARPAVVAPDGPSSAQLAAELEALPAEPHGDLRPHPTVTDALHALDLAEEAMRTLGSRPAVGDDPSLPEDRLRDLARRLRTPQLPQALALEAAATAARADVEAAGPSRLRPLLAWSGVSALSAGLLLAIGAWMPALALLLVAAVLGGLGWNGDRARREAQRRLAHAEAALAPYREAAGAALEDRGRAEAEARQLGLPADPSALDELADRARAAVLERAAAEEWQRRHASAAARRDLAIDALAAALRDRGEQRGDDLRVASERYAEACEERARLAADAARRPLLERELSARRAAEERCAAAIASHTAAEGRLRDVATRAGLAPDLAPKELEAGLVAWQEQRAFDRAADERALAEWHQLQTLLNGRTLDDLRADAVAARRRAAAADAAAAGGVKPSGDRATLERQLVQLREQQAAARSEEDGLRGNLEARRESLPDVAEAEEALEAARRELERVERLGATVDQTIRLLRAAEERVHRSVAPILAGAIGRWLPVVSDGAYTEAGVDPASLAVRVKEAATGEWREARLLSEGTREQIYLLLRVAMAQHLVTTGETAPMLLDEVTVQSDAGRKRRLLDVLHALSSERQIVLFTHDDDVVGWAEERLGAERDAHVRLPARDADPAGALVSSFAAADADGLAVGAVDRIG